MSPKRLILVVDDNCDIRDTLEEILEQEGYLVTVSSNGQEALAYLQQATVFPSYILLDLMMPVMDGIQFLVERKKNAGWNEIPVVVISSDTAEEAVAKGLQLETVHYLRKPIDLRALLELLKR